MVSKGGWKWSTDQIHRKQENCGLADLPSFLPQWVGQISAVSVLDKFLGSLLPLCVCLCVFRVTLKPAQSKRCACSTCRASPTCSRRSCNWRWLSCHHKSSLWLAREYSRGSTWTCQQTFVSIDLHTHLRPHFGKFNPVHCLDVSEVLNLKDPEQITLACFCCITVHRWLCLIGAKMERYVCMFSFAADKRYSEAVQQARSTVEAVQEFGRSSVETNSTLTVSSHNEQHLTWTLEHFFFLKFPSVYDLLMLYPHPVWRTVSHGSWEEACQRERSHCHR